MQKKMEMEKKSSGDNQKNVAQSLVLASKEVFKVQTIDVETEPIKKAKVEQSIVFESTMSCESSLNGPKLDQAEPEEPKVLMNSISSENISSGKLAKKFKPMLTIDTTNLAEK